MLYAVLCAVMCGGRGARESIVCRCAAAVCNVKLPPPHTPVRWVAWRRAVLQFGLLADVCDKQVDAAAAYNDVASSHNSLLGGSLAIVSVLTDSCFSGSFAESISRSAGAFSLQQ